MDCARIRRLALTNFRSYRAASIELSTEPVVLVGANGAGKTNLIEAISFLTPGRGLRRATLEEVAFSESDGSWAVAAEVEGALGLATLGTGIAPAVEDTPPQRMCRIDREPIASVAAFADHIRVIWLTPAMDRLFNEPALLQRHGTRVGPIGDVDFVMRQQPLHRAPQQGRIMSRQRGDD